jgi:hypothetical protein
MRPLTVAKKTCGGLPGSLGFVASVSAADALYAELP